MKDARKQNKAKLPAWALWCIALAAGGLCAVALVYYWRVAFRLPLSGGQAALATLCAALLFWALIAAAWFLRRAAGQSPSFMAAAAVLLLGLLFCFATAPMQAPDESQHYMRSYAIAHGQFNYDYNYEYPEDVQLLLERFPGDANHKVKYAGRQLAPAYIEDYLAAKNAGEAPAAQPESPIMFLLVPFLPSAICMAVARLFGFGALGLMYAARIGNLLVYAFISYFTFKNAGRFRAVFIAIALLPLSLFMAASCSYDSIMLALCFFLLSYLCKKQVRAKDVWFFIAALALANYIKPLNFLFAGVLLLIPKDRWDVQIKKWRPKRWQLVAIFASVSVLFWFGLQKLDANVLKTGYPPLPRGSGDNALPEDQLIFMLKNPLSFIMRCVLTVVEADAYLFDLGRLGGMDLILPLVGGLSVVALLLAAFLAVPVKKPQGGRFALGQAALAFCYFAAVLAGMYVGDTDYQAIRISGPQPRYFLPVFLILLLLLATGLGQIQRPRLDTRAAALKSQRIALGVCAAVAFVSVILVFQYYFVGQWVPKSEGGHHLVNYFGRLTDGLGSYITSL